MTTAWRQSSHDNPARPEYNPGRGDEPGEAILGGGCFWCTEAVFQALEGVTEVTSGYAGGAAETANYKAVCTGRTGHAEAIRVRYDRMRIDYGTLLKVFFGVAHDPTQVDRQGGDRGPQYRSVVFYANPAQRQVAEAYISQLDAQGLFSAPVATRLEPLDGFHDAEAYHQDFVANNPKQPYACMVAAPKVDKLRQTFPTLIQRD